MVAIGKIKKEGKGQGKNFLELNLKKILKNIKLISTIKKILNVLTNSE